MERFLIELEHEPTKEACEIAIKTLLETGSHFLTHADWGCLDNDHRCWIIVEVDNQDEARAILPLIYKNDAKIIRLKRFSNKDFSKAENHQ
jgi:hypothetical protein